MSGGRECSSSNTALFTLFLTHSVYYRIYYVYRMPLSLFPFIISLDLSVCFTTVPVSFLCFSNLSPSQIRLPPRVLLSSFISFSSFIFLAPFHSLILLVVPHSAPCPSLIPPPMALFCLTVCSHVCSGDDAGCGRRMGRLGREVEGRGGGAEAVGGGPPVSRGCHSNKQSQPEAAVLVTVNRIWQSGEAGSGIHQSNLHRKKKP